MAAKDFLKTEIRLRKIAERARKTTYKGLSTIEKTYIKKIERKNQLEKDLYGSRGFYATAPRNEQGGIAWDKLSEKELAIFDMIFKEHEKIQKSISKFEEKHRFDEGKIIKLFQKHQANQLAKNYSGSF